MFAFEGWRETTVRRPLGLMSCSPSDLVVAYRSFPRRAREALDSGAKLDAPEWDEMEEVVRGAVEILNLRAAAHSGFSSACGLIAEAIASKPADKWGEELFKLENLCARAGVALRALTSAPVDTESW